MEQGMTLITGASAGIGRALAYQFASRGHDLIITARRESVLAEIADAIMKRYAVAVTVDSGDISDHAYIEHLCALLGQQDVSVLINNAGFGDYSYPWDIDRKKAQQMVDVNISALMHLSMEYVRLYREQEATLINVSSRGGYQLFSHMVPYCATKFYVSALTEGIAGNLQQAGSPLRVKALVPGATESEFMSVAEAGAVFRGSDIIPSDLFISAELLAEYAYRLYESDSIVGMINFHGHESVFELVDPVFPFR